MEAFSDTATSIVTHGLAQTLVPLSLADHQPERGLDRESG